MQSKHATHHWLNHYYCTKYTQTRMVYEFVLFVAIEIISIFNVILARHLPIAILIYGFHLLLHCLCMWCSRSFKPVEQVLNWKPKRLPSHRAGQCIHVKRLLLNSKRNDTYKRREKWSYGVHGISFSVQLTKYFARFRFKNKQTNQVHAMHTNQLKIDSICGLWYFHLFSLSPGHSLAASLMFKCQCCASNAIQPSLSSGHSPSLHSMNPFQFANETYWITFRCDSIS